MSQRRMTSDEALAARESLDNLPENVTPLNLADPCPTGEGLPFTDPEWDENDPPAPENPLTDEDVENFLAEQGEEPEKAEEPPSVGCEYCGQRIIVQLDGSVPPCTCKQSKAVQNSARMVDKVDMLFGPGSGKKYGFPEESDSEELSVIKQVGALVAQHRVKGVTMTLDNGDKAVIQNIKDNTVVRHTKATKAEAKA